MNTLSLIWIFNGVELLMDKDNTIDWLNVAHKGKKRRQKCIQIDFAPWNWIDCVQLKFSYVQVGRFTSLYWSDAGEAVARPLTTQVRPTRIGPELSAAKVGSIDVDNVIKTAGRHGFLAGNCLHGSEIILINFYQVSRKWIHFIFFLSLSAFLPHLFGLPFI